MLTAILLAAGLSRRMGAANKLLLPFGGSTLLGTTARHLLAANIGETLVVLGHEADEVRRALAGFSVQFVENERFAEGMTSSIQAGVAAARADATGFLICPGDMPFLQPDEFRQVADFFEACFLENPAAIVQPTFAGGRGHPVVFSQRYRRQILENTFPDGCRPVLQANAQHLRLLDMATGNILRDVDVPSDLPR